MLCMDDGRPMLEYFHPPMPREQFTLNLQRIAALGYVALCIVGLCVMVVVLAMQI